MPIDINALFATGLHKLDAKKLILLSEQQDLLLHKVDTENLVYLIQELASRLSDMQEATEADKEQAND